MSDEFRDGTWSLDAGGRRVFGIKVSMPGPIRYTCVYALPTAVGFYLVDSGSDDDQAWTDLCSGLDSVGLGIKDCRGVLLTHGHSDHHGLSARVREASGAWLAMHPKDAELVTTRHYRGRAWAYVVNSRLQEAGAPSDVAEIWWDARATRGELAQPDQLLEPGTSIGVPGWDLQVIQTPGHTPGHVCLFSSKARLLFSGDHVLPSIAGRIGFPEAVAGADPVDQMVSSLRCVAALPVDRVLPGHESPFTGLSARCDTLVQRHSRMVSRVVSAVRSLGTATAWQVAIALGSLGDSVTLARPVTGSSLLGVLAYLHNAANHGTLRMWQRDGVSIFEAITDRSANTPRVVAI